MHKCLLSLAAVLVSMITGCTTTSNARKNAVTLRGVVVEEFERSEFITCEGVRYGIEDALIFRQVAERATNAAMPLTISAMLSHNSAARLSGYEANLSLLSAEISDNGEPCAVIQKRKND